MKKLLAFISLFLVLIPALSLAADFRTESVNKNENVHNLYVAGQNVNVDANVTGDLNAAGNSVNISGNVERTAQIAGSTINLRGNVGGSARLAGNNINIDDQIGEDLIVFGAQVTIGPNAVINHDLIVMSGNVVINGNVKGNVRGNAGNFEVNGTVGGDVNLSNVGTVKLGNNGVINGKLTYGSPNKSNINESQVKKGIEYKQITNSEVRRGRNFVAAFSLLTVLGAFLLIYLLSRLAPLTTERYLRTATLTPWANMGIGFITLVVVPVALVMLMISVIGVPFAGLGFLIYILILALSGLLMSLVAGSWVYKTLGNREKYEISWLIILIGVILTTALKFIPIIGWIVLFLLFLLALGAMARMLYQVSFDQRRI